MIEAALFALLSINSSASRKTHVTAAALHAEVVYAIEARNKEAAAAAMARTVEAGYVHARHAQKGGGQPKA